MSRDEVLLGPVPAQFSGDELAHLSLAIVAINGWNRLKVVAHTVPGDYVPRKSRDPHESVGVRTRPAPAVCIERNPSSETGRQLVSTAAL